METNTHSNLTVCCSYGHLAFTFCAFYRLLSSSGCLGFSAVSSLTVSGCPFSSPLVCIDLEGRLVCEDHLVLVCVCVLIRFSCKKTDQRVSHTSVDPAYKYKKTHVLTFELSRGSHINTLSSSQHFTVTYNHSDTSPKTRTGTHTQTHSSESSPHDRMLSLLLLITYEQKQKLRDFPLLAEKGSIPPEIIDIYKH